MLKPKRSHYLHAEIIMIGQLLSAQQAHIIKMTSSTSMRRDHVASTLIRCHFNVVCPLGGAILVFTRCLDVNILPTTGRVIQ